MKMIIRFVLVLSLVFVLGNEPPRKQAVAEVKTPAAVITVETNPNAPIEQTAPVETPAPQVILTPKEQAIATLNDLGQGDSFYAVDFIVSHESSWNPTALNSIGACGLFQALPCSKLPCDLNDVPCQVRWANNYALQRYGSWHNAHSFWVSHRWW